MHDVLCEAARPGLPVTASCECRRRALPCDCVGPWGGVAPLPWCEAHGGSASAGVARLARLMQLFGEDVGAPLAAAAERLAAAFAARVRKEQD